MSTFGIAGVLDFGRRSWAVARIACRLRRFAGRVLVARMERSPYHRDRGSRTRDRPTRRRRRPWLPEIKGCGALTAATFALSRAAVALWRRFGSDNIAVPRVAAAKRTNAVAWVAVAGGPLNYSSRSAWVQVARARSRSRGQVSRRPATRRLWVLLVICSSRSGPLRDWVTDVGVAAKWRTVVAVSSRSRTLPPRPATRRSPVEVGETLAFGEEHARSDEPRVDGRRPLDERSCPGLDG